MTNFARVFQPILLRLNYRLTSTFRYLQRLFIHKKITPARLACLCFPFSKVSFLGFGPFIVLYFMCFIHKKGHTNPKFTEVPPYPGTSRQLVYNSKKQISSCHIFFILNTLKVTQKLRAVIFLRLNTLRDTKLRFYLLKDTTSTPSLLCGDQSLYPGH